MSGRLVSTALLHHRRQSTRSLRSSSLPRLMRLTSSRSSTSRTICSSCRSIRVRACSPASRSVDSRMICRALRIGASGLRSSWASVARNSSLRRSASRSWSYSRAFSTATEAGLSQLHQHRLVVLGELPLVLVGQLDEADVPALPPDQRGGEVAPHERVVVGPLARPRPPRMPLQFGLRQPHRPVRPDDLGIHARLVHLELVVLPPGVLVRQGRSPRNLSVPVVGGQGGYAQVATDQAAGLLRDDAQHGRNVVGGVDAGRRFRQPLQLLRPFP